MKIQNLWMGVAILLFCNFTSIPDTEPEKNPGIKKENRYESVKPGDDFFQFANGGWIKANPLTPEYSRYGSFEMLEQKTNLQLQTLINNLAKSQHPKGSVAQKVADLYNLSMDSIRRNKEGYSPIKADQKAISNLKTREQLFLSIAEMEITGMSPFFSVRIGTDRDNSNKKLVAISQGGIGMGQKDYYTETTESTVKIRDAYKDLMVDLFLMTGNNEKEARIKMQDAFRIENRLANASLSRTEMRDPTKTYHKIPYAELKSRYNKLDWDGFFKILGYNPKEVNVSVFEFLSEVQNILTTESLDALKNYLTWNLVNGASRTLSDEIEARAFEFSGKTLTGSPEQSPRWKRSLQVINRTMGMALGQMYAEKYFPKENKERMMSLVQNLLTAMGKRIDAQEWMSDVTKKRAHDKLSKFKVKIAYPDKWKDYSGLTIDPSKSFYENMKAV